MEDTVDPEIDIIEPIPEDEFHVDGEWANINLVPHDRISGVIYKRAITIKCVAYEPACPAPEMPEPWQGDGTTQIRWLFSEDEGTEEGLLRDARFAFLQDVVLEAGSSTGQRAMVDHIVMIAVVSGDGMLYHRPTDGSPVVARPLRPGDAALIYPGELFSLANEAEIPLRVTIVGLHEGAKA